MLEWYALKMDYETNIVSGKWAKSATMRDEIGIDPSNQRKALRKELEGRYVERRAVSGKEREIEVLFGESAEAADPGETDPGTTNPGGINPGNPDPGNPDPGEFDPGNPGGINPGNPGKSNPTAYKEDQSSFQIPSQKEEETLQVTGTPETGQSDDVQRVFDYWLRKMHKPAQTRLTDKRRRKIKSRLKDFSPLQLKAAIDACAASSFHMGQNDGGKTYNDLADHILKSTDKVEWWLENSQKQERDEGRQPDKWAAARARAEERRRAS